MSRPLVLDDDERALSSTMTALRDLWTAARAVYDAVAGCGPLQRYREALNSCLDA